MSSVSHLQSALANTFVLYAKVHSFHWNVTGTRFQELHSFFEELYTHLWKSVDDIAERIRIEGEEAPRTLAEIISGADIRDVSETPTGEDMLRIISEDLTALKNIYIEGAKAAGKEKNYGCLIVCGSGYYCIICIWRFAFTTKSIRNYWYKFCDEKSNFTWFCSFSSEK